jgi:hypothetical protein
MIENMQLANTGHPYTKSPAYFETLATMAEHDGNFAIASEYWRKAAKAAYGAKAFMCGRETSSRHLRVVK